MIAVLMMSSMLASAPAATVPAEAQAAWASILRAHVSDRGLVDYRAIDVAPLDRYLAAVAAAEVPRDRDAALAFYADAYNALVIRAVITAKRPRSVLDVKGFFDGQTYVVGGKKVTLNALEKELVAPLGSPDHHFLLVCGAVGCPRLERAPLVGSDVRARASAAARAYLATPRGAIVRSGELELSKIFEWYAADFGGPAGVLAFARAHLPREAAEKLGQAPKVRSLEYDWTLNQP